MLDILKIGTSAGALVQSVIAYNEQNGQVKSGQTSSSKGFEHWLKLDHRKRCTIWRGTGYGRIEMAYSLGNSLWHRNDGISINGGKW
jgi:serine/threonine-protein kinase HipA